MGEGSGREAAEAFLGGDSAVVEEVRAVVEAAVCGVGSFEPDVRRDLVQEVLGRIVQSLRSGRFRGESSLTTYAFSVARHACIERSRRLRREGARVRESQTSESGVPGPEASLIRAEEHRRNVLLLAALPQEARELLQLVFVENLSYREIGRRLGITEAAVKSRVHRCRMMLRGLSRREGPGTPAATWRVVDHRD